MLSVGAEEREPRSLFGKLMRHDLPQSTSCPCDHRHAIFEAHRSPPFLRVSLYFPDLHLRHPLNNRSVYLFEQMLFAAEVDQVT